MAITYPRPFLPKLFSASFELDESVVQAPEQGGDTPAARMGQPRWAGQFQTSLLDNRKLGQVSAWLDSLGDGLFEFYAHDPKRPFPLAYPSGFAGMDRAAGGAFDGTFTSWSVDVETRALLIGAGLPADFEFNERDSAAFEWINDGPRRFLVRLLEAQTANEDGEITAIQFTPALPAFVPSDAVLNLDRPSCIMKLIPGSKQVPLQAGENTRASFSAMQVVKA